MSLRNLFDKNDGIGKIVSNKSLSDLTSTHGLESVGVISASFKKYDQLLPNIDFSDPVNFVKYGSAEKYYDNAVRKIATTFPYDGSKKQKLEWRNNASYLDLYLFDNEYPRHTGSITIGTNFGTASVTNHSIYSTPARVEYIKVGSGLQTGSIYNNLNRKSAFSFNSEDGFCVEFYLKQDQWSADLATASCQCIFDMNARYSDLTSTSWGGVSPCFNFFITTTGTSFVVNYSIPGTYGAITYANAFQFGEWNRFSVNVFSGGAIQTWKNGNMLQYSIDDDHFTSWPEFPVDIVLSGNIGAFSENQNSEFYSHGVRNGYNKFSGSLDDFRFWRSSRTDKEIILNWFCDVDGGFDDDEQLNPDMGFYYKFNESTVGTASYDARVLDYSGRGNHGTWIGYQSGSRIDFSPMTNEFRDPILHLSCSRVYSFWQDKILQGREHDLNNNGCIVNQLPGFLNDEDENNHFGNLTQIIASMFDRLWLQINSLTSIKDTGYFNSGSFSSDILLKLLNSNGLSISNILDDYTLREIIQQKSDGFAFENSIEKIKQTIYKNIYNNLIYIFKSKGTEKAIKSIFRTFGVDDDVLKIKSYAKSGELEIDGAKRIDSIRRKNLLDLSGRTDGNNMVRNVFNQYIPGEESSVSYFTSGVETHLNRTIETTIVFPRKFNIYDPNNIELPATNLSASLFGVEQIDDAIGETDTDCTFANNNYSLNMYCVQKSKESRDAKFVAKYSVNKIVQFYTETDWYEDVYNDSKWTLGLRYSHSGTNPYENIEVETGAYLTSTLNFFGINEIAGNIIHTFSWSRDINKTATDKLFMNKSKLFVGAERTNITGTLQYPTQAKFAYMRMWQDYLNDQDIINHAFDAHNFGIHSNSLNYASPQSSWDASTFYSFIPKNEALMLNWDFENDYTPDSNGIFTVSSFRGKSIFSGIVTPVIQPLGASYSAIGYGFNSGSVVIDKNYIIEQKNKIPTDFYSNDSILFQNDSDLFFGRRIIPIEYFYTIENSIYNVISEDILNMFSSIDEFNNLFGNPVERYRVDNKLMTMMRRIFFSKIQNPRIDIEKYISYYRWLDDAISQIVSNVIPVSANADMKIRNVIESHVLERNKLLYNSLNFSSRNMTASIIGTVKNNTLLSSFSPRTIYNQYRYYLNSDGDVSSVAIPDTVFDSIFPSTSKPRTTILGWIRTSANGAIFDSTADLNPRIEMKTQQTVANGDTLYAEVRNGGVGNVNLINPTKFTVGQWNFFAFVADATKFYSYVNFHSTTGTLPATPYAAEQNFYLFNNYIQTVPLAGDLYSIAVFNTNLSDLNIYNIYNGGMEYDMSGISGIKQWWRPSDSDLDRASIDNLAQPGTNRLELFGGVTVKRELVGQYVL